MNWKYLIIPQDGDAFFTEWYDHENFYEEGMIVVNIQAEIITRDGKQWERIEGDEL